MILFSSLQQVYIEYKLEFYSKHLSIDTTLWVSIPFENHISEYRYPNSSIDTLSCRSAFIAGRKLPNGSIDDLTYQNGVSELCSLVYSGGLSRDLSEFFIEIKDPNKSFQKEIKIVIFLWFMLGAFSPVNRKRRSSFRCLTI
ncbi:hypothetical protein GQ457_05G025900 [Hibiscus cannabinus]